MRCPVFVALAVSVALAVVAGPTVAQDRYPSRPVKLIIPFPPGGQTDITARSVGAHMSQTLGQPLAVENRSGAAGSIGTELASKAAPDGYTLLLATSSTHSSNPYVYPKLGYHPIDSFTPVAQIGIAPLALAVHSGQPFRTVQELVTYAKANPGRLSYGSAGVGSLSHIMGALFNLWAGIDTVHVPYAGAGPEVADLMAGVVQMDWNAVSVLNPGMKAGSIHLIATTMARRARSVPNLPSVAEAGYPEMDAFSWTVLFGPAGLSKEVVATLSRAVNAALDDRVVGARLEEIGLEPVTDTTPEKTAAFVKREYERWGPLVKLSGAKVE
jgi:tripartite-type tricarboxylate transporter receptor subunit TctC